LFYYVYHNVSKFDLDKEFTRNKSTFEQVDVTTKLIDSTDPLYTKINSKVEVITLVFPEKDEGKRMA
jgi:hypothetical protein